MADLTLKGQYEEALRLIQAGKPREAVAVCHRILQTFPRHFGTYSILGQAALALGEYEQAANLFRRALSADPEHVLSHVSLAAIYERQGRSEEACWSLERAFELSPGDRELRCQLRQLYTQRNLPVARLKMTRAALARVYLRCQLYSKAIRELRELVTTDPQRLDLRVALAEALWHDGHYEDAAVVCQGILAELPNCLKANLILGQVWLNTDQDGWARALLQKAQSLDPDNAVAQAIFGSRSALPPRTARLPLRKEDAPEVALPYLVDDEEVVAEGVIIEGQVSAPQGTEEAAEAPEPEPIILTETPSERPPLEMAVPNADRAAAQESGRAKSQELGGAQPPSDEAGLGELSLTDVQRQYVQEHPNDYLARLDLGRLLCEDGALDQALEEYGYLVREDYMTLTEVTRDLDLLNRRYPDLPGFRELLRAAREKTFLRPPSR